MLGVLSGFGGPCVIANQREGVSDGVKQSISIAQIASARSYPTQPRNDNLLSLVVTI